LLVRTQTKKRDNGLGASADFSSLFVSFDLAAQDNSAAGPSNYHAPSSDEGEFFSSVGALLVSEADFSRRRVNRGDRRQEEEGQEGHGRF